MARRASARAEETYEAFRQPLQSALSCVTAATFIGRRPFPLDREHPLELSQVPAPLGRRPSLSLRLAHRYRIVPTDGGERWEVRTTGYSYWLNDRAGHELLLYQWVPEGPSPVKTPHLHMRALAHPDLPAPFRRQVEHLVKAHLPTGHVTFAAILRVAIDDLGVEPLRGDWRTRLVAADAALRASLMWQLHQAGSSPP